MKRILITLYFLILLCPFDVISQDDPTNIKLSEYRPVSIYNTPKTEIKKAMYPIIDMHTHVYARTQEQLDEWVKIMDEVGIQKSIVLSGAYGTRFDSLSKVYSRYPDRFDLWCGFDYTGYDKPGFGPAAVKELERCVKMGAKGVGELGDKGKGLFYCRPSAIGMHSDDPRMDPLFKKCAELDLPVNIHVGDPKWMYEKMDATNDGLMNAYKWRLDNKPDIVSLEGMVNILENTVKRHPNTTFVACHLANCTYNLDGIGVLLENYSNLYIDISARFSELSPIPRKAHAFFVKHSDKIVYGTDQGFQPSMYRITFRVLESADEHFYDWTYSSYHWAMYGMELPEEVLEKVYLLNAGKILGQ
ncbi:amidohydrolase family protein [Bacteroidota bacterium]